MDDPERERWLPTREIVALLEVPGGARVLDYGTGTGRYALGIAREHPDAVVTAFDIQQEMLQIVQRRMAEGRVTNIRVAGPERSALSKHTFDRILGVNLLHEIDDEDLLHMRELLRANGVLLVIDWESSVPRDFGPPPEHVHTVQEALLRIRRAGFPRAQIVETPSFPYHYVIRAEIGG
ncbi:MAG TPA: class I SAM-dependent methyltransferase [Candidatus Rubrimentiphilum sp.]|nr:class I SAM-dependent methyltransferase [Candidatus Rubrimentiphilum sp.]